MKDAGTMEEGEQMSSPERWRRRDLLLAVAAITGLAPHFMGGGRESGLAGSGLLRQVLQALGHGIDRNEVDALGASILGASIDLQLARILRLPAAAVASQASGIDDLKRLIRDNIAADYRAGEIRVVNGWWLSATEASCLELIVAVRAG